MTNNPDYKIHSKMSISCSKSFFVSLLLGVTLVYLLALSSCGELTGCGDSDSFFFVTFDLLDKDTGESLLWFGVNKYFPDTVALYDEKWFEVSRGFTGDGYIGFGLYENNEPLNTPLEKTFFLYLDQTDIDTINISMEAYYDKCNFLTLENFALYFNDSLYIEGNDMHTGVSLHFMK